RCPQISHISCRNPRDLLVRPMAPSLQRRAGHRGMAMNTMLERIAIWGVLVMTVAAGCDAAPASPVVMPPPMTGPVEGGGDMAMPPGPRPIYGGVYALPTPLDLTQNGVLPGMAGPALDALMQLHDHPGTAIVELVMAANVPVLSSALEDLGSFVRDLLE